MKRILLAASAAATIAISAAPGTASACDPGMPTCGSGTVVENVERWANTRLYVIGEFVEDVLRNVEISCPPACA